MITIECIICQEKFDIYKCQAGTRFTCSSRCKYEKMRRDRLSMRKIVTCLVCGKNMSVPSSIAKTKKTCSKECDARLRSRVETRKCLVCGKSFSCIPSRKQKLCSADCGKEWVSKNIPEMKGTKRDVRVCEICERHYKRRNGHPHQRFCSKTCVAKAQSLGKIKSHSSGNYGFRPDLSKTFRSSFEANFARVANHLGWKWEYEPECFDTPLGFYTPDFKIDTFNGFVELRGIQSRSREKAMLAAKLHGFNLTFISQAEFEKEHGHLQSEIPDWEDCRKAVWIDVDPSIYEKHQCVCGKWFYVRKSSGRRGMYCSRICANKYKWEKPHGYRRRDVITKECEQCKKSFSSKESRRFCSHKCYAESLKRKDKCHRKLT